MRYTPHPHFTPLLSLSTLFLSHPNSCPVLPEPASPRITPSTPSRPLLAQPPPSPCLVSLTPSHITAVSFPLCRTANPHPPPILISHGKPPPPSNLYLSRKCTNMIGKILIWSFFFFGLLWSDLFFFVLDLPFSVLAQVFPSLYLPILQWLPPTCSLLVVRIFYFLFFIFCLIFLIWELLIFFSWSWLSMSFYIPFFFVLGF